MQDVDDHEFVPSIYTKPFPYAWQDKQREPVCGRKRVRIVLPLDHHPKA
jgi:hypothetical protein